ncbi:hypothetical protein MMC25_002735 [Agyrium rufum]|nr:hypothetical protein [Agyrium rufum]
MPSIPISLPSPTRTPPAPYLPSFPSILKTPSGLAILELQGKINHPPAPLKSKSLHDQSTSSPTPAPIPATPIGRITFPVYDASIADTDSAWMKKVYMYVGPNQRLRGEVKKLAKPLAVLRKKAAHDEADREGDVAMGDEAKGRGEEVEILEIVRWKVLFSERPEPVGLGD